MFTKNKPEKELQLFKFSFIAPIYRRALAVSRRRKWNIFGFSEGK